MDSDIFLLFQKEKLKQEMVRQHAKIHAVSTLLNQDLKPVVTVSLPATYPGTSPLESLPLLLSACSSPPRLPQFPLPTLSHCSGFSQRHLLREIPPDHSIQGAATLPTVSLPAPFSAPCHCTELFAALFLGSFDHKNCINYLLLCPQGLTQCLFSKL